MTLRIFSDLHIEDWPLPGFRRDRDAPPFVPFVLPKAGPEDVLVLAGDTCEFKGLDRLKAFLGPWSKDRPIIHVPGNHEYGHSRTMATGEALFRRWAREHFPGLRPLAGEGEEVTIGDVSFLGGTMWTDFSGRDPEVLRKAYDYMPEYRRVRIDTPRGPRELFPEDTLRLHEQFMDRLEAWLARDDGLYKVAITHTAPAHFPQSRHDRKKAGAYVCTDVEGILAEGKGPGLWIHGHTHESVDFVLGRTRIVSNPLGFWDVSAFEVSPGARVYDAGFTGVKFGKFDGEGLGVEVPAKADEADGEGLGMDVPAKAGGWRRLFGLA
ncbi:MAG: metallophosphoesterase [Desulfovibrio sp.]|jgi:predicted phosphodiesterase|nr:metallophosphoesterase [Desulfovibrio sp.]